MIPAAIDHNRYLYYKSIYLFLYDIFSTSTYRDCVFQVIKKSLFLWNLHLQRRMHPNQTILTFWTNMFYLFRLLILIESVKFTFHINLTLVNDTSTKSIEDIQEYFDSSICFCQNFLVLSKTQILSLIFQNHRNHICLFFEF